ncbi:MAG: hypothetical protein K1X35_06520 [Caulobacteraceae bacterium]|nr:hypothetical protein [Caulobacteraceae bacterium]
MRSGLLLAACVAALVATPADAAPNRAKIRRVIEQAGLMGWSAQDCSRPAGSGNAWEQFSVDEDGYVLDIDYEGTDGEPFYVVDARRLSNGDLRMKLEVNLGEPDLTVTYRLEGGRHMTWTSRTAEGTLLIDESRWVNSEEAGASVWYTRCPGPPPEPAPVD